MRDKLIELIKQKTCHYGPPCDGDCGGCTNIEIYDDLIEALADHLLSNGVIVPPCKVGDTVYRLKRRRGIWEVLPREVVSITHRLDHLYRLVWEIFTTEQDRLGKTVFLTREEAEKALAERNKENDR